MREWNFKKSSMVIWQYQQSFVAFAALTRAGWPEACTEDVPRAVHTPREAAARGPCTQAPAHQSIPAKKNMLYQGLGPLGHPEMKQPPHGLINFPIEFPVLPWARLPGSDPLTAHKNPEDMHATVLHSYIRGWSTAMD